MWPWLLLIEWTLVQVSVRKTDTLDYWAANCDSTFVSERKYPRETLYQCHGSDTKENERGKYFETFWTENWVLLILLKIRKVIY